MPKDADQRAFDQRPQAQRQPVLGVGIWAGDNERIVLMRHAGRIADPRVVGALGHLEAQLAAGDFPDFLGRQLFRLIGNIHGGLPQSQCKRQGNRYLSFCGRVSNGSRCRCVTSQKTPTSARVTKFGVEMATWPNVRGILPDSCGQASGYPACRGLVARNYLVCLPAVRLFYAICCGRVPAAVQPARSLPWAPANLKVRSREFPLRFFMESPAYR